MKCMLCGLPIAADAEVAIEVKGWVSGPKKDHMRLREETGFKAHVHCVTIVAAGQDPMEPDLFGPDRKIEEVAEQNQATVDNLEDLL